MKESGGFLELENYCGREYHTGCLALNSGRNCLRYLIRNKQITKIYLPKYNCRVIADVCVEEKVDIQWYTIDRGFLPILPADLEGNRYLYVCNFYGQLSDEFLTGFCNKHGNCIVDYSQAFFQKPIENVDAFYTCRKFWGVPDGAYLYTDNTDMAVEDSERAGKRLEFLAGRYENTANEFYAGFLENEKYISGQPIKKMSSVARNFMRSFDYGAAADKRHKNFKILDEGLRNINQISPNLPRGPYMYPLLLENGSSVRHELNKMRIYVPILWPDVLTECNKDSLEYYLAGNLVPLPCDQRYSEEDMRYIIDKVSDIVGE